MPDIEGFVWTERKGERTYYPAVRMKKGIARWGKNGEGKWCGPKLASTFFEHTWKNVTQERLAAERKGIEEFDRLMPKRTVWRLDEGYDCKICGAIIHDRNMHWRFHFGMDRVMEETLQALFPMES